MGAGDKIELPILSGTAGQDVIDIRALGKHGYFTYDPGFLATGSCESSITFIDGAEGVLLHRASQSTNWLVMPTIWKFVTCCCTVMHRIKKNTKNSKTPSSATPWYMSKFTCSSMDSVTMPTLWP